jgi:hypothetical protein
MLKPLTCWNWKWSAFATSIELGWSARISVQAEYTPLLLYFDIEIIFIIFLQWIVSNSKQGKIYYTNSAGKGLKMIKQYCYFTEDTCYETIKVCTVMNLDCFPSISACNLWDKTR